MSRDFLPRQNVPIAGRELATNPYYVWFQGLERLIAQGSSDLEGLQAQIDALREEVENLPGGEIFLHQFGSVQIDGQSPNYFLSLVGDTLQPGNTYYYGTGPTGAKGWFTIASALTVEDRLTMTVGLDGVVTFDLAELTNTGIGASPVKIYTRDVYGRIEGDQDADTDNLPEGATNLYFTDERAQDAVGTILVDSADIDFTYSDATPSITGVLTPAIHASLDLADSSLQPGDNVSELTNDAGYITDAPSDGTPYARQDAGWVPATGGGGTVTSVGLTAPAGFGVSGSPVTGSGTLILSYSAGYQGYTAAEAALVATAVQPGDLATVATTGAYSDLSGLPTLGTMAAEDAADYTPTSGLGTAAFAATTDFATAAQGVTADSAVQPGDAATTLNMATARLLGRTTAGAGAVEEISVGANLTLSAGVLSASAPGTGTVTSVAVANATGITWTGSPITTSGTLTPTLSANLQAWSGLATSAKENAFSKGDLIQGSGVTLTGTLTGRLVGAGNVTIAATGGSGTVTSVGFSYLSPASNVFDVSGSPITGSGTISTGLKLQDLNHVFAGPSSGAPDAPTFRLIAVADIPALTTAKLTDVAGGTYTPTLTAVTNVASSASANCFYQRVGNVVSVSGRIQVDPTTGTDTLTEIGVSLPIASNLTASTDLAGVATFHITTFSGCGFAFGDTTNDRATLRFSAASAANGSVGFEFKYEIK